MKRAQKQKQDILKKEKFVREVFPQLQPKNKNQQVLLDAMNQKYAVIAATGSAGSGKTYLACWYAARKLFYKQIDRIILLRAYQPLAGRSIGFLPGTADEKLLPYYQQMIDYLEDFLGKETVSIHLKHRTIEICSLETIRGRSWDDSVIIVDESQNLYVPEVQALTTRIGEGTQMVFCGDNSGIQTDIKKGQMDGLTYLKYITDKYRIEDSAFIQFTRDDIQRSGVTKEFVIAFEEEQKEELQSTQSSKNQSQRIRKDNNEKR
jgi:phosphate starvation-inducible protein PhoH and related proteins